MTHEGRLTRGEENVKKGILLDNEDTKYFLKYQEKNKPKKETKKVKEVKDE
jgi:hypothetical protein